MTARGTVVVKLGGAALVAGGAGGAIAGVVRLRDEGWNVVVVHGGGPEITAWQERLGIPTTFVGGLRVTDVNTIEIARMVLTGNVGPRLVTALGHAGARAAGLSGEDAATLTVRRFVAPDGSDLGFVGEITNVATELLHLLLEAGIVPVLATIGVDGSGQAHNINADTAAAEVAVALGAQTLVLMTDVASVLDENGKPLRDLDGDAAIALIESGTASGGMIPKLRAAVRSLDACAACHIIDGRDEHPLAPLLAGNDWTGTTIRRAAA